MGDKTGIEWTDATWTPIRARNVRTGDIGWHCEHKSEACRHCYAEALNLRLGTKLPFKPGNLPDRVEVFLDDGLLQQPLRWQRPRNVFVCSMTDLFGRFVKREWIAFVFAVMALAKQHRFQVLTKRPEWMAELLNDPTFVAEVEAAMDKVAPTNWHDRELGDVGGWPLRNVSLGTSAGDQDELNANVPELQAAPAAKRFLSYEPAIGPIEVKPFLWGERTLDWVIAGGESGDTKRKARPAHPGWFRSVRDECAAAGVPFFFKQWGDWQPREEWSPHQGGGRFEPMVAIMPDGSEVPHDVNPDDVGGHRMARVGKKKAGAMLDGREHREMPT